MFFQSFELELELELNLLMLMLMLMAPEFQPAFGHQSHVWLVCSDIDSDSDSDS